MNKDYIETILLKIGTPVSLNGYKYIVDSICLLDKPEWSNPKWSALYDCVANLNYTTSSAVEKGIRKAFQSTRDNCADYNAINHYIGFSYNDNSNSLMQLYKTIKLECDKTKEDRHIIDMFKIALNELISERAI